jgi:hypothetical protein
MDASWSARWLPPDLGADVYTAAANQLCVGLFMMASQPAVRYFRNGFWLVLIAALLPAQSMAQWAWRDAQGRLTYSDTPPPPDIPAKQIVRSPSAAESIAAPVSSDDNGNAAGQDPSDKSGTKDKAGGAAPAAKTKTLSELDADFRKRREDRLKAEKEAADASAQADKRRQACDQARGYLDMVNSGMRVMRANPDGTRGFIDDEQRAQEVARAQESIGENCAE